MRQSQEFLSVEKKLGIRFKNKALLKKALTHSSAVAEDRGKCNEILEFLGDAVLELIVREFLVRKYPHKSEGELNLLKKRYTSEEALYKIGKTLHLGEFLTMDRGEEITGGRLRHSNISAGFEALIGAIYLDQGLAYTQKYFQRLFLNKRFRLSRDCKSLLNEWAMKNKKAVEYRVVKEEGPPHKKIFNVALYVNGKKFATGKGTSKKNAEQDSARIFLKKVKNRI
ncbi:MAG: ribonuclease III [candidate division WOR-3 bacterium]